MMIMYVSWTCQYELLFNFYKNITPSSDGFKNNRLRWKSDRKLSTTSGYIHSTSLIHFSLQLGFVTMVGALSHLLFGPLVAAAYCRATALMAHNIPMILAIKVDIIVLE